jgi:proteic killer suppression protein
MIEVYIRYAASVKRILLFWRNLTATRTGQMIKTFKDKETEAVYKGFQHPKFPPDIIRPAKKKLQILDAACDLRDLKAPPSNSLEALRRDREGQWSIKINRQWRLCFVWQNNNAFEVEIVDYH